MEEAIGNSNPEILLTWQIHLGGPWKKGDLWLVTGALLPQKNPNEIIHGY